MYKTVMLAIGLALAGGSAALAAPPWTGGDNLPTNPLACDNTPSPLWLPWPPSDVWSCSSPRLSSPTISAARFHASARRESDD